MKIDSIIFDLDGTLWNTNENMIKAVKALREKYLEIKEDVTEEQIEKGMGHPLSKIADIYFPYLDNKVGLPIVEEAFDMNIEYVKERGGKLYPELENTLKELSKKYKLFIVSNCKDGYIESFLYGNEKIKSYFTDYECIGRTGLSKADNIRLVMNRNNLSSSVYVGDTIMDKESADKACVPFVYAKYGFGDIENYPYFIDNFCDLPSKLDNNQ